MSFRLDRFLTLHFFGPLARRFPPKKGIRIPILMYHSISDDPETGHPYFWINTSPARFAEHMKFLHDNNYQVISLSTAVDLIRNSDSRGPCAIPREPRSVVLTFDDGYKDFYTCAFPLVKRFGYSATVFLPTNFIENERAGLRGKRHLGWNEIICLQKEGIEFGSHTCSHPQLYGKKSTFIAREIRDSKSFIEEKTGRVTTCFCYPFRFPSQDGGFVETLRNFLMETGYKNCVTTRIGSLNMERDIFQLKRLPINSSDDLAFFHGKLEGGYDWLYNVQSLKKLIRAGIF
jgi:peptidoglycan/xylan/chitin deacetylase (PgdA/CDA1 family)